MLKKTPQNDTIPNKDAKSESQEKAKKSKKGKNRHKKNTGEGSKKLDDIQKLADERLMKELQLSSSESEVDDKKNEIKENQLKRGMSSNSEEDNQTKKVKNDNLDQQQAEGSAEEVEMDSQSDEEGSNQGGGSEAEPEEERIEEGIEPDDANEEEEDKESFLYIKGKDFDITQVSAYRVVQQIEEALQRRKPIVTKINRCLRVTCHNHEEKQKVKEIKYLVGHAVEITEPFSRANRVTQENRGIIFGIEDDVTDEEISMEIGMKAERIIKRRGDTRIRTAQVILHVEGPLPEYVRIGWRRHRVSTYTIPPPTRCYKCQRFGHIANNSGAKKEKCPICAGPHPYQECQIKDTHRVENKASCSNCRGPHPASYQECPANEQAKICKKIQTNEGISYAAAVKKHKADQLETGNANRAEDATPKPRSIRSSQHPAQ